MFVVHLQPCQTVKTGYDVYPGHSQSTPLLQLQGRNLSLLSCSSRGEISHSFPAAPGEKSLSVLGPCVIIFAVFSKSLLGWNGPVVCLDQIQHLSHMAVHGLITNISSTNLQTCMYFRGWLLSRRLYMLKTGLSQTHFSNHLAV